MAVPTYEELLTHCSVNNYLMEQTCNDYHLTEFGAQLDEWERLASFLSVPSSEVEDIKSQGGKGMKGIRLLQFWKRMCGFKATYKAIVKALLQIYRADLAEKVVALQMSLKNTVQSPPSPSETSLATPTSPASSSGTEDTYSIAIMSPSTPVDIPTAQDLVPTLTQFDEDFFKLVHEIESTLTAKKVQLNIIKNGSECCLNLSEDNKKQIQILQQLDRGFSIPEQQKNYSII